MRSLAAVFAACLASVPVAAQEPEIEDFEFDVETIAGERVTHDSFADKVLLIDLWGTWCPPCRRAIPHLVKLYEKHRDRGFAILGLSYERTPDPEAALARVKRYAEKHGITYPLALGTDEIRAQIPNFRGYPTLLFFRRGKFDHMGVGFSDRDAAGIEKWIERALAGDAAAPPGTVERAEQRGKPAAKRAPAVQREFEALDGGKVVIGDGKTHVVLVLVHPRMKPSAAALAALREREAESKGRLHVVLVTREDLAGGEGVYRLKRQDLEALTLGRAFPAYRLYAPSGRRLHWDAGKHPKVVEALLAAIDRALAGRAGGKAPGGKRD